MPDANAIVLGASGSVGQALLAELVRCGAFKRILVTTRRPLGLQAGKGVEEKLVPEMVPAKLTQAVVDALGTVDGEVVGFSVLGIGAGTARISLEEHRAVDVELNKAFAAGLKASGKVRHLAFMSSVGADVNARTTGSGAAGMPRYLRVKGESEEAVKAAGPEVVSVFRPSMIIGSRHTPRALSVVLPMLSWVTPGRFRAISTEEIAQAMVAASLSTPAQGATYHYPEMVTLTGAS